MPYIITDAYGKHLAELPAVKMVRQRARFLLRSGHPEITVCIADDDYQIRGYDLNETSRAMNAAHNRRRRVAR